MLVRRQLVIGVLAAATLVMGACGGDDDDGSGDAGLGAGTGDADVTVVALDTLEFDRDSYAASAGEVTIDYENGGNIVHTLLIEGVDDFKLQVSSGGDIDTGTVELEPGEYRIYCDVPGHSSMKATLTVE